MSVNLTSAPPAFAFSADLITAKFLCAGYLQQAGVLAKNTIDLAALQAFGPDQTVAITYQGVSITMMAQASPDDSGNSFKANAATPAEVAQGFQANFRLNADFTLLVAGSMLTLTAKTKSDKFNFATGGTNTVIGKADILKPNYSLVVRLFCQNADHSSFELINESSLSLNLNNNGLVDYPVADKLHNYIANDVRQQNPDIPAGNAILCKKSFRKYYIAFSERYGEVDVAQRKLNTSANFTILHGGLSHKAQFQHSLQSLIAPGARNLDRFLKQGNNQVYTRTNQPQFLYFFNTRASVAAAVLKVKIFYKGNTSETKDLHSIPAQQYQKVAFDVSYSSIKANAAKVVEKYEVWLASGSTVISETRTYHLNYQLRSYVRYFLNWSSWGSLDTRLCYGKGNTEFELLQSEAKRVLKSGFDIKQGNASIYGVSLKSNFSVATGWMNRSELLLNRDFYLSPIKYRFVGGLMMPIAITSDKINELEDGNHLYAQAFGYRYLYDDHAYTEGDVEEPGLGFGDFFFSSNPVGGNPSGGITETDPTVPIWVKQISQQDITKWNTYATLNHVHGNLPLLESLSFESDYLLVNGKKIKAGFADNAQRWNNLLQPDYLTQPVRPGDEPKFKGTGSPLFVSGFSGSGWEVKERNGDIHATVDKLTVRKEMNVYELIINQIRATNGSLWISDAIKILTVTVSGSNYNCTIDTDENRIGVPFRLNDILRCQRWTGRNIKYYVARVSAVGNGTFTLVRIDGGGIPEAGDDVVRMGNTTDVNRQGALYLTASDDQAPYLDVIDGVTSASLAGKTRARLGKLSGITDPDFGALDGYGIYSGNGYFKGSFWVKGGNAETKDGAQAKSDKALADSKTYTGTEISAVNGRILLKADQETVNGLGTRVSASEAAIVLVPNRITAAVNSIEIGGRNLLLGSGVRVSNPTYMLNSYVITEQLKTGEKCVITLYGTLGSDRENFRVYNSGGQLRLANLAMVSEGIYQAYFTWTEAALNTTVQVYQFVSASTSISVIEKIKLERGTKATDWTPAPEDIDSEFAAVRSENSASIVVLNASINSKVATATFNALGTRVSSAETAIGQNTGNINLRATKTELATLEAKTGNLVNNPAVTGVVSGWAASGLSVVNQDFSGVTIPVLQSSVSADTQNYSDYFEVDPSKAYEVSVWMKKSVTGTFYFGLHALNKAGSNIGLKNVNPDGTLANESNDNSYFKSGTLGTAWTKMTAYIMPAATDPAVMKGISNSTHNMIMRPDTNKIRIRFLNWSNAGTTRQLWVANPKVVEVDANLVGLMSNAQASIDVATDAINLKVSKGDISSTINQTIQGVTIDAAKINLHGALTIAAFATADKNTINNSSTNASTAKGFTDAWRYLNTTEINGGAIRANTIVALGAVTAGSFNLGSGTFAVTSGGVLTAKAGKIAGFTLSGNNLTSLGEDASILFGNLKSNSFMKINESPTSPLISMRTDKEGRTGIDIATYASGATALRVLANVTAGSGFAMESFGPHKFHQRSRSEYWSAPGMLGAVRMKAGAGFPSSIQSTWGISSISLTISKPNNATVRWTHNLGHADYTTLVADASGDRASVAIETATYVDITLPATDHYLNIMLIGRNKA